MGEKIKAHCNHCSGNRNHEVLTEHIVTWDEEECGINGEDAWQVIQCCGCDEIKFRRHTLHDECHMDYETGKYTPEIAIYPPPINRPLPEWVCQIEDVESLEEVLKETYIALENGSYRLASIGLRTAFDLFACHKVGDVGTFLQKLEELVSKQYITTQEQEILNYIVVLGNASAHKGFRPKIKAIEAAIESLETILHRIYIQPYLVEDLNKRVQELHPLIPQRQR